MAGLLVSLSLHPEARILRADTEEVCISLSVIGYDDGDPGTGCVGAASSSSVESSASSASSSEESSSDASVSSASSALSDTSSEPFISGTSGPFIPSGSLGGRLDEKIAEWGRLHRAHSAAPSACAESSYVDVPDRTWFTVPVRVFRNAGYIDPNCFFRPADSANRAEFAKLLVHMSGGSIGPLPAVSSFNDVSVHSWYFPYAEEAARQGWMLGNRDCYGSRPCFDLPAKAVTRAEAAQMIVRFFHLSRNGFAPVFSDNPPGPWYTRAVQIAADHCVLLGDDETGLVRPDARINRAEMVTMLARAMLHLTYGTDCAQGETSRVQQHGPLSAPDLLPRRSWFSLSKTLLNPSTLFQSLVQAFGL